MSSSDALELLRRYDPARTLEPLPLQQREAMRDRILVLPVPRRFPRSRPLRRPLGPVAAMAAAAVLVGVGTAWAAGAWSPAQLFQANPQHDNGSAGTLWDQHVIPSSVSEATSVDLPRVGAVGFWYGNTAEQGWCAALQLPSGDWVGTGHDPLDAGGTVPGCSPTRDQINAAGETVYGTDGFDYQEGDIDARSLGGAFWRIRYGRISAPDAVRVTDTISGRSAPVVDGNMFVLAIPDPNPTGQTPWHLVAYDATGKYVADDSQRP